MGNEVNSKEPDIQWQFCVLENGPADKRSLAMTNIALVNLAIVNFTIAVIATLRTNKTLWPPHTKQYAATDDKRDEQAEKALGDDLITARGITPCTPIWTVFS